MGESLIERRRVPEEALRGVKGFSKGRTPLWRGDGTLGIRGC